MGSRVSFYWTASSEIATNHRLDYNLFPGDIIADLRYTKTKTLHSPFSDSLMSLGPFQSPLTITSCSGHTTASSTYTEMRSRNRDAVEAA